jgi:uncharacterized Zn-finger protein
LLKRTNSWLETKFNLKETEFTEKFSPEAKEMLESNGYTIFYVNAQPLGETNSWSTNINYRGPFNNGLLYSPPKIGEAAYKPEEPFIENSFNKNRKEQSEMLEKEVKRLRIPGVQPVIDHPAVYRQIQDENYMKRKEPAFIKGLHILTKSSPNLYKINFDGPSVEDITVAAEYGIIRSNRSKTLGVVNLVRPK